MGKGVNNGGNWWIRINPILKYSVIFPVIILPIVIVINQIQRQECGLSCGPTFGVDTLGFGALIGAFLALIAVIIENFGREKAMWRKILEPIGALFLTIFLFVLLVSIVAPILSAVL